MEETNLACAGLLQRLAVGMPEDWAWEEQASGRPARSDIRAPLKHLTTLDLNSGNARLSPECLRYINHRPMPPDVLRSSPVGTLCKHCWRQRHLEKALPAAFWGGAGTSGLRARPRVSATASTAPVGHRPALPATAACRCCATCIPCYVKLRLWASPAGGGGRPAVCRAGHGHTGEEERCAACARRSNEDAAHECQLPALRAESAGMQARRWCCPSSVSAGCAAPSCPGGGIVEAKTNGCAHARRVCRSNEGTVHPGSSCLTAAGRRALRGRGQAAGRCAPLG